MIHLRGAVLGKYVLQAYLELRDRVHRSALGRLAGAQGGSHLVHDGAFIVQKQRAREILGCFGVGHGGNKRKTGSFRAVSCTRRECGGERK